MQHSIMEYLEIFKAGKPTLVTGVIVVPGTGDDPGTSYAAHFKGYSLILARSLGMPTRFIYVGDDAMIEDFQTCIEFSDVFEQLEKERKS